VAINYTASYNGVIDDVSVYVALKQNKVLV